MSKRGRTGWWRMLGILLTKDEKHPPDCPEWEYARAPNRAVILPLRSNELLTDLALEKIDKRAALTDSRPIHHRLFVELTPQEHTYFAGHYRGEPFRCLQYYRVVIPNDPRVGTSPEAVAYEIEELGKVVRAGIDALEKDIVLPRRDHLRYLIAFACRIFECFLRIHPYANGNGHAARFTTWCVLSLCGYWPRRWKLEPRPDDPPYTDSIVRYRNGDKAPLEQLVAQALVP